MTTVYVIEWGEYSSAGWGPIFTTREAAELFANRDSSYDITECGLDEGLDLAQRGYRIWDVVMRRDGSLVEDPSELWPAFEPEERYHPPSRIPRLQDDARTFRLLAKSKQQAIKVANERRAMLLALERWDNDD